MKTTIRSAPVWAMVTIAALLAVVPDNAFAEACQHSERWGPDDEIGNANLVTPERVKAAAKLIKTGKTYPLGIIIDSNTPAFPPRGLDLQVVQPNQAEGARPFTNFTYNDDLLQTWLGIGPQIDGLGHLGEDGLYYNCNHARDFAKISGLEKLGIEKIPPIVARGVLIDMAKHYGVDFLEGGRKFGPADIQAAAKSQGVEIREGDVVLFNTGWTAHVLYSDPAKWVSQEPGITEDAAEWLASKNVIAVGADTWGLDVIPPDQEGRPFQGHVTLLKDNGIYILETMNTEPLVADGVSEFMFVLGQARIRGAVQMIINPVAIR